MPIFSLTDGTVVKIYQNPVKIEHVFLADRQGQMIYGGYVDWSSSNKLKQALEEIRAFLAP